MQNSIFDIFGNQTFVPRSTSNVSKSSHGRGAIIRGPVKPHANGPAPKKVLGDLRSNVLCDVGNRTNHPLPSTSKGGVKKIIPQKDLQCKPGTSFGWQKNIQPKKLTPNSKADVTFKPVVQNKNQTNASCSLPSPLNNMPGAVSCGVGSVFPKHLQLTVEDIEMLGNLTSFRPESVPLVLPEIVPIESVYADDLKFYKPCQTAPLVRHNPTVPLLPPLDE